MKNGFLPVDRCKSIKIRGGKSEEGGGKTYPPLDFPDEIDTATQFAAESNSNGQRAGLIERLQDFVLRRGLAH